MDLNTVAWSLLLLPLIVAATIMLGLRRWSGVCATLSTGASFLALVFAAILAATGGEGEGVLPFRWLHVHEAFEVNIGLKIDALSRGMMLVVASIGFLVHLFSLAYMKDDSGKSRYFAGLSIFLFSMTGIVLSDNFVMMFIFWELVGVSSFLLIGHWYRKDSAADAAKKAFLVNRVGDFGFMVGVLLLWTVVGSFYFDGIRDFFAPGGAGEGGVANTVLLNAALLFIFCGVLGKSAQFPLHVWLPDAMEGPTPVSALIHAATMVAAGVYMLARIVFIVEVAEFAAHVITWIGAITALLAALMALQQDDIKRILAYSTLSQLGYMVMAQGVGGAGGDAGMFHLYTHAFFKALLFLGAGAVIFACHHQQDIWKMGGLRRQMPITFWTFALGTAALIAVPFTSGFWSKESILEAALAQGAYGPYAVGIVVAFLTPFYMTRLFLVAFFGKSRSDDAGHAKEVGPVMWVPLAVLAFMSVFSAYGFIAGPLLARVPDLEHHFGLTAVLSLLALAGGVGAAFALYRGKDADPISIPWFRDKFYFDELYARLVKVCQDGLARVVEALDGALHLLVARFPAGMAMAGGRALRLFQTGNVQVYALLFGAAAVLLILLLVL